jgi:hypothetical protein
MVPGRSTVSAKREAEVSQLRAVAAGRLDAVQWSTTEGGHHWTGFPALGTAVLHCTWETPDRRLEYGGLVTRASRTVRVERKADPYEALTALALLALDMAGVPVRPSSGPTLRVVRADAAPVAAPDDDGRPALRPAG